MTANQEDEEMGCAECAAAPDASWPYGSDICGRCWDAAEADMDTETEPEAVIMRDPIFILATFEETGRFLDDMAERKIPSLTTDASTDAILRRLTEQYHANRTAPESVKPDRCEQWTRKACTQHPQWRVRQKGDTASRNWYWVCNRHLAAACASYGEGAQVDVIREGL